MAATTTVLPAGYREACHIDLQKDKKLMLLVNLLALAIMLIMGGIGHRIVPLGALFDMDSIALYALRFIVLIGGIIIYLVLHELVHGIFMRGFSGVRPHYGFTGLYAYAGSTAYFNKKHYIIIALAPVVIWGIVLAVLTALVPDSWFWPVYFIQMANISGAAGDLYVFWRLGRMSPEILVNDTGVAMTVYLPEKA